MAILPDESPRQIKVRGSGRRDKINVESVTVLLRRRRGRREEVPGGRKGLRSCKETKVLTQYPPPPSLRHLTSSEVVGGSCESREGRERTLGPYTRPTYPGPLRALGVDSVSSSVTCPTLSLRTPPSRSELVPRSVEGRPFPSLPESRGRWRRQGGRGGGKGTVPRIGTTLNT